MKKEILDRIWNCLVQKLSKDGEKAIPQAELAREANTSLSYASQAIKEFEKEKRIACVGHKGRIKMYKLLGQSPEPDGDVVLVHNKALMTTPAGTDVMAAFSALETVAQEIALSEEEIKTSAEGPRRWAENDYDGDDEDDDDYGGPDDGPDEEDFRNKGEYFDWIATLRGERLRAYLQDLLSNELRTFCRRLKITIPQGYMRKNRQIVISRIIKHLDTVTPSVSLPPEIFFQFVKSKLTPIQLEDLSNRLLSLSGIVQKAELTGQTALYEQLVENLYGLVREQEIASLGLQFVISEKLVRGLLEKFNGIVMQPFEKFPRVVPPEVVDKIAAVKLANVFDTLEIVYTQAPGEKDILTTSEKITKKDPIVFGKIKNYPDRLYFIADWIDEFCDMTLEKMIAYIKVDDPSYSLGSIGLPDKEYLDKTIAEMRKQNDMLSNTRGHNYKRLSRESKRLSFQRENEARLLYAQANTDKDSFMNKVIEIKGESWLESLKKSEENKTTMEESDPNQEE